MSLRARLIGVTLLLTGIGLGTAALVTYSMVESFLVDQMDESLASERRDVFENDRRPPGGQSGGGGGGYYGDRPFVPVSPGTYAQLRAADGTVTEEFQFYGEESPALDLPATLDSGERFLSVGSADGTRYRVYVSPFGETGEQLIFARPLAGVSETLDRLVLIELAVSGTVLLVIGALMFASVSYGLRPLGRVVETADAISEGDLGRRVPEGSGRTEVGRLGAAFNAMLGTIEESFGRQQASELRLRSFVADASHELRTPLTSMKGYAELLARPELAPEDRSLAVARIEEASNRMTRLVEDMLLLARLDEEPRLHMEPVDLSEVAAGAVADARVADPTRVVTLEAMPEAIVEGDRDHLTRAIANLLANVRMHTPAATPAVVGVRRERDTAIVEVRDSGPGIAPEAQTRLFDRFFRADKSRARARGGAGLGLSIVASIAEAHGGRASIESQDGGGTVVRMTLPLAAGRDPGEEPPPPREPARASTGSSQPIPRPVPDTRS